MFRQFDWGALRNKGASIFERSSELLLTDRHNNQQKNFSAAIFNYE